MLHIVDISNPLHPKKISNYDLQGNALGIKICGKYTYVADGGFGFPGFGFGFW